MLSLVKSPAPVSPLQGQRAAASTPCGPQQANAPATPPSVVNTTLQSTFSSGEQAPRVWVLSSALMLAPQRRRKPVDNST
mmetsp:Transcript_6403/g.15609  ORF Transcript_6403/g.15609 Transcript_6403/m.15609 type:complete len:80 (-) Transcript_6403:2156-2395(-)